MQRQCDGDCSNHKLEPGSTAGTRQVYGEKCVDDRCSCTTEGLNENEWETLDFRRSIKIGVNKAFLFSIPAPAEWVGPWRRGGGGGRPGEDVNRVAELVRDGGRRGPEDAEILVEGVGGRMEDEEDATAEVDEGGLTGVLLLRREIKV